MDQLLYRKYRKQILICQNKKQDFLNNKIMHDGKIQALISHFEPDYQFEIAAKVSPIKNRST